MHVNGILEPDTFAALFSIFLGNRNMTLSPREF